MAAGSEEAGPVLFSSHEPRQNVPNFQEPLLSRNLRLVESLRHLSQRHGRTPGRIAIACPLPSPAVTGAIVGFRTPRQMSGIIGALEFRLAQEEVAEIAEVLKQKVAAQAGCGPLTPNLSFRASRGVPTLTENVQEI